MYNQKVLDHFANPRNVAQMDNPDGVGQIGNPADGDKITIFIEVDKDILVNVTFKAFGCGAAIAASSMLTELAKGKTIQEGLLITNSMVSDALGGLPPQKMECSNIAAGALHEAIRDYMTKEADVKKTSPRTTTCAPLPQNKDLLTKEEINRYLRHIIIPQISGKGQKKLLSAQITLYAKDFEECEILLYYLLATGIKEITLYLEECKNWNGTYESLRDFNPDANVEVVVLGEPVDSKQVDDDKYKIIFGHIDFAKKVMGSVDFQKGNTLIALAGDWKGGFSTVNSINEGEKFIESLQSTVEKKTYSELGLNLCYAFLGSIVATEVAKKILGLGNNYSNTFYFDLLTSEFHSNIKEFAEVYKGNNQIQFERILSEKKVLIIGAGGLGSPVAYALTKAGVGKIGLVDYDFVEISNLNRQILHSTSKVGMLKVESAKQRLLDLNNNIFIETYPFALNKENARELIKGYDIVVDGLDNIPTRYILNDACYHEDKPLIAGGVLTFYGQLTTIIPNQTPCYRCFLPEKEETSSTPPCSELGVLGPVPGSIGILEAIEAVKVMLGIKSRLQGSILMYDGMELEFTIIPFLRSDKCQLCSS